VSYVQKFIKTVLNSCVKLHNKGFPGGWIHACRTRNNAKTDFSLLNSLGWTEKVPSNHKMLKVLFDTVDPKDPQIPNSKDKLVNITQDRRNMLHTEFRTAVALTLPRIDTSKPQNFEEDMKRDPLSVRDLNICNNFCKDRRDLLVDALNESYVLRVSLQNPKSKTREIHYKIFRDKMLNLSSNIPLIDGKGKQFATFSKLPEGTQKFLREKFRYPVKRGRDEESGDRTTDSMLVDVQIAARPDEPPSKKRTMSKGQAREATRKSGRVAGRSSK